MLHDVSQKEPDIGLPRWGHFPFYLYLLHKPYLVLDASFGCLGSIFGNHLTLEGWRVCYGEWKTMSESGGNRMVLCWAASWLREALCEVRCEVVSGDNASSCGVSQRLEPQHSWPCSCSEELFPSAPAQASPRARPCYL